MQKAIRTKIERQYTQAVKDFKSGNFTSARKIFDGLVQEFSDLQDEFIPQVMVKVRVHLAMIDAREAPQHPPLKTSEDKLNQAIYHLNAGQYEPAVKLLEKLLAKDFEKAYVHYLIAIAHLRQEDPKATLEHLKKAIKLDGFYKILAYNESDFAPLTDKKEFLDLVRLTDSDS